MPVDEADVVVVGAGIQGAAMAQALGRRGLQCLLLEREPEPAAGVSANSYGIVHGGLRYLQSLDIDRWRRSKGDQRWYLEAFPDQVRPLRCVMPLYRGAFRSPAAFRLAFLLEQILLKGLGAGAELPTGGLWSRAQTLAEFDIPADGLVGAAVWYDAELLDAPRVVRALLSQAGPSVRLETGVEVVGGLVEPGGLAGVRVRDAGSDRVRDVRAPLVVLCAGPQSQALAAGFGIRDEGELGCGALAFNILYDARPDLAAALAVSVRPGRGRSYFIRPTADGLLAGTEYVPVSDGRSAVTEAEVRGFHDQLRQALPGWDFDAMPIKRVLCGRLPDADGKGEKLRSRDVMIDHGGRGGPEGLFTVLGVKLTTAHDLAEQAAEMVIRGRRRRNPASAVKAEELRHA
ncbi:FAD-dependent oxidoreductase [Phenylobacterium sp. LjRoot225]|uniref:FAD-dependent oxidoreductase n=1 Tax=Phenylobacterium sp. LjRoot225 TaxID=3342285 RepID=UPI003ECC4C14